MKLKHVLAAKIIITILLWALPLLLGPPFVFHALGFPEPGIFMRLLGAAYTALVVAYWHGWLEARSGGPALAAVRMGIVSNGGASILLLVYGFTGEWSSWGLPARAFMWTSLAATSLIALGLMWKGRNLSSP